MGISQSESGKFSFRFWGFSIDKTQLTPHFYIWISANRGAYLWMSMPSRAWVVTAGMSNILNFLWYFLCIPAIYKCILAYLPIFFNQLSDFLRCESPNTFLGTCLSHHSFIILLITHGLIPHFYRSCHWQYCHFLVVSMPSRAYTSFLQS